MTQPDENVRIKLQFRGMDSPLVITVPSHVRLYLDTYADRRIAADGTIIYHHPAYTPRHIIAEHNWPLVPM